MSSLSTSIFEPPEETLQRRIREDLDASLHSGECRRVDRHLSCESSKTETPILASFRQKVTERLRHESCSADGLPPPTQLRRQGLAVGIYRVLHAPQPCLRCWFRAHFTSVRRLLVYAGVGAPQIRFQWFDAPFHLKLMPSLEQARSS